MRSRDLQRDAQVAVHKAVAAGQIPHILGLACDRCERQASDYHHHLGYAPEHRLDIQPLCRRCHRLAHLDTPIPVSFPNRLHAALHSAARSRPWLSRQSGYSQQRISRVANGHQRPSRTFQKLIAEALGVPFTAIWPKNGRKGRAA